jgi:hypothetical protein
MAAAHGHWAKRGGRWRWVGKLPWRTKAASQPAGDLKSLSRWMNETSKWGGQVAVKLKEVDDRLDTIERALQTITRQLGRHG